MAVGLASAGGSGSRRLLAHISTDGGAEEREREMGVLNWLFSFPFYLG